MKNKMKKFFNKVKSYFSQPSNVILVIFLLMYLLIPKIFDKISNKVGKNYLYGCISFIVLPLILLILLFTNYATSVAIIGIMLYVIFIMISKVLVGYILGKYIYTKIFK